MMKKFLFQTLLFFLATAGFSNTPEDLFKEANQAYQNNDFQKAAGQYEHLLENSYRSPELEFNLANAYYRLDSLGPAILHYERALMLSPADRDVKHNLALAREKMRETVEPLPDFFLEHWWKSLRSLASSTEWGIMAMLFWWGGFAGFAVWLMSKARKRKKRGFFIGAVCLTLSLLPFSLALSRMGYEQDSGQAIVMQETASLRSAPDQAGTEIMSLYEGTKVKLLDWLGGWWKVQLPNGDLGWIPQESLEKI